MRCSFLLFLTLLSSTLSAQQFRYAPERPVPGEVVSFTYTPGAALAKEATIEGRYVRYAGPALMRLSQPVTATAVRQGNEVVGELKLPKNNVAGLLLAFQSKANVGTDRP